MRSKQNYGRLLNPSKCGLVQRGLNDASHHGYLVGPNRDCRSARQNPSLGPRLLMIFKNTTSTLGAPLGDILE